MSGIFGDPTRAKYRKIDRAGRENLRNGKVKPFGRYGSKLRKRLGTYLVLDPHSVYSLLWPHVLGVLETLEEIWGVEFRMCGRDYTAHTTILEAAYRGSTTRRHGIFQIVENQARQQLPFDLLEEQTFPYSWILNGGGNVLLTGHVPQTIKSLRRDLAKIYKLHGLRPLKMDRMFHITVARLTTLPPNEDLEHYINELHTLGQEIESDPLELSGSVAVMSTYNFLTGGWE